MSAFQVIKPNQLNFKKGVTEVTLEEDLKKKKRFKKWKHCLSGEKRSGAHAGPPDSKAMLFLVII